jgi:FMN phosphatase YigB (HAD superfamily)
VKKLIVFDLDGTLAESKSAVDPEMSDCCMTFSDCQSSRDFRRRLAAV